MLAEKELVASTSRHFPLAGTSFSMARLSFLGATMSFCRGAVHFRSCVLDCEIGAGRTLHKRPGCCAECQPSPETCRHIAANCLPFSSGVGVLCTMCASSRGVRRPISSSATPISPGKLSLLAVDHACDFHATEFDIDGARFRAAAVDMLPRRAAFERHGAKLFSMKGIFPGPGLAFFPTNGIFPPAAPPLGLARGLLQRGDHVWMATRDLCHGGELAPTNRLFRATRCQEKPTIAHYRAT